MHSRLKAFIQYLVILGVTFALIWFSLRGIPVSEDENKGDYLYQTWQSANKSWLLLMAVVATISHVVRAERWRLLMVSAGSKPTLGHSFLSLMIGYLVNLVIPRGGEVSRCYNLYKLDKTPVETSFGTVVVERIVDLLCLIALIGIAFLFESKKLFAFIDTLPISAGGQSSKLIILATVLTGVFLIGVLGYWFVKRNASLRERVIKAWNGFREGLLSILKLEQKALFIFYSIFIWFLYFVMSYMVILAFPQTEHLGFGAVLSLFAIGAIAMAAPLPGGTGSYHVLVPQGLVFLYAVPKSDAVAFTFIFHGWQTAIMIIGGAISILVTSYLMRKKSVLASQEPETNQPR